MNKIELATAINRIKAAWRTLTGKPKDTLTFGLEIKRCDDCGRGHCEDCGIRDFAHRLSRLHNCNDCGKIKTCEHAPAWGADVRYNCPLWEKE